MSECFLMSLEIIFLVKKQRELEKKLHKKEANYNFWKDKEQNGSLTNSEKKVLKKIDGSLKNFKKYLKKLQKYQHNVTHGLDYLLMNSIITDQQKSRVLLMVVMYYMKVKEIKTLNYQ